MNTVRSYVLAGGPRDGETILLGEGNPREWTTYLAGESIDGPWGMKVYGPIMRGVYAAPPKRLLNVPEIETLEWQGWH